MFSQTLCAGLWGAGWNRSSRRDPLHSARGTHIAPWTSILLCPPCSVDDLCGLFTTKYSHLPLQTGLIASSWAGLWFPPPKDLRASEMLINVLAEPLFWAPWVPHPAGVWPLGCSAQRCRPQPHCAARAVCGHCSPARQSPCRGCGAAPLQTPLLWALWLLPLSACHFVPFLIRFGCWKHHFCLLWASRCL